MLFGYIQDVGIDLGTSSVLIYVKVSRPLLQLTPKAMLLLSALRLNVCLAELPEV